MMAATGPAAASGAGLQLRRVSPAVAETARLAARLAGCCPPERSVIHLCGSVGAGKSEFARAMIRSMGVSGSIPSPSFSLVQVYRAGGRSIGHFDFYRCADAQEWRAAGLDETLGALDLALIEWPQKAGGLPVADIRISIAAGAGSDERVLDAAPAGGRNEKWLCRAWL